MEKYYTYIDFDGVILDSEERMLERKYQAGFKNHECEQEFDEYFEYTNLHPEEWNYILKEAKSINNSVEILKELDELNEKIAILTKIHTLYEMKSKVEIIRDKLELTFPVIFVPPGVKKHQVIIPNNQLLVDDSKKNINSWISHGGRGYIFDSKLEMNNDVKVKSLEFLLKR